jgi:hypothetical protein
MALVGSNSRRRRRRKKQTLQEGPHYGIGPRQEHKNKERVDYYLPKSSGKTQQKKEHDTLKDTLQFQTLTHFHTRMTT